jgi:perosamine synthetase
MIPVCKPTLSGNEKKYVNQCLKTNWISSHGSFIEKFEKKFAQFCKTKYAVAVSNGTTAIHLALESLGIGQGDEVIIPNFTMIATANAVLYTGAKPIFVDAKKDTWNINPDLIENKINAKTKAIIPVHIYGHPCNMDKILQIAEKNSLYVLEDAAEAHGALFKGHKAGSLGHVNTFSLYANKIITSGEGGVITTNNDKINKRLKTLRNHAFSETRFIHEQVGFNYRMTNLQAAIALAQLEQIEDFIKARRQNAFKYQKLLADVPGITFPAEKEWAKNVYWMFGILINKEEFGTSKEVLMKDLYEMGVETRSFFYGMNQQPAFNKEPYKISNNKENFHVSRMLSKRGLYLPSSSDLKEKEIIKIVNSIKRIHQKYSCSK